jgi:hypothetical protein
MKRSIASSGAILALHAVVPIVPFSVVNRLDAVDDFDRALDSVEASMNPDIAAKEFECREFVLTREELRQIVAAAVTDAIAVYEKVRAVKAEPEWNPPVLRLMPNVPHSAPSNVPPPTALTQLQDEMGLDEIAFEAATPAPEPADLPADIGVDGFAFDDAPRRPAQYPLAPIDRTVDAAMREWDEALKQLSSEPGQADEPSER